jgi:hypothetical protein
VKPIDIDQAIKLVDDDAARAEKLLLMSILIPIFIGLFLLSVAILTIICIRRRTNAKHGGVRQNTVAVEKAVRTEGEKKNFVTTNMVTIENSE